MPEEIGEPGILWEGFENFQPIINDLKNRYINSISDLKSSKRKILVLPENERIEIQDGTDYEKYIYVNYLNVYFKKEDKHLLEKDYITGEYIYTDIKAFKEKMNLVIKPITIYNGIDEDLNFIACGKTFHSHGKFVEIRKTAIVHYFTLDILKNPIFIEKYVEDLNTGIFYEKSKVPNIELLQKNENTVYRKSKNNLRFEQFIKDKPVTYSKLNGKEYTFGLEIETSSGILPKRLDLELCYSAVHDGSLKNEDGVCVGGEYVTDVLYGDMGLKQLKMLSTELSKRCFVNNKCGVHSHIGNFPVTKENVILMYNLYQQIQDEVFSMLPYSRRNNEYCRSLRYLDINLDNLNQHKTYYTEYYYNQIIYIMTKIDGSGKSINKKTDHPKGFKCNYDHSSERYCWVNFVPLLFNTRGNKVYTIKFCRLFK